MAIQPLFFVVDAKDQGDCEAAAECAGCIGNTQP